MLNKLLTVMNAVVAIILIIVLMNTRTRSVTAQEKELPIRTQRIEITDPQGKVTASLGYDLKARTPVFSFYDETGRQTVSLAMNTSGDPSLYFLSKDNGPTVAVGYIKGSDAKSKLTEQDPLGTWGVQVEAQGGVKSLNSFEIDPDAQKRVKDAIKPVRVPSK